MDSSILIQIVTPAITLISAFLIYKTIKTQVRLNEKILFDRITKEERELRIKFQEYREKIKITKNKKEKQHLIFTYETILFNYYEYLAICLHKKIINENDAKLYFTFLLRSVKEYFNTSSLFEENQAGKNEYPGILWLLKKWKI
jgi:hypothetical protein